MLQKKFEERERYFPKLGKVNSLSNYDINEYLRNVNNFQGVYSIDNLPSIPYGCGVVNLDKSYQKGSHWVCYYNDDKLNFIEYFDPFGEYKLKNVKIKKNFIPQEIVNFLKSSNKKIMYNDGFIQDISSSKCGAYCCYYIIMRNKKIKPICILNQFTEYPSMKNENKILEFFSN